MGCELALRWVTLGNSKGQETVGGELRAGRTEPTKIEPEDRKSFQMVLCHVRLWPSLLGLFSNNPRKLMGPPAMSTKLSG